MTRKIHDAKIAVIGLGYVGLPLAVEFGKKYPVSGFDVDRKRIEELSRNYDRTLEVSDTELSESEHLDFSNNEAALAQSDVFIVTVPTPIDEHKRPDFSAIKNASEMVGRALKTGGVVVYESTVYPGATEEICVPLLEAASGLTFNQDFSVGYSPERINPGDKEHRLPNIIKVTSGSNPEAADFIDGLYQSIIPAGTHKASSIKVAEAAKVIENTQRDLNIALVNELSKIFALMGISTNEVLDAAASKWNFLNFRPGLVGGHCIGVDPYYLTHKSEEIGYHPEVILSGRRINDGMGSYIVTEVIKGMLEKKIQVNGASVLVLGLAFKENCPDIRNSKVKDVVNGLLLYHVNVDVYDPWVEPNEAKKHYNLCMIPKIEEHKYDAVIVAVAHNQFKEIGIEKIHQSAKKNHIIYDIKGFFNASEVDYQL